jgi:hypothetical protein
LGLTAALLASCQSASNDAVRCGPGTVERDLECVPDLDGGGGAPEPNPPGAVSDAALPDASVEGGADAGPIVHDGDPCPTDYGAGGCSDNRMFFCQHQTTTDTGKVVFTDFSDCSLLGGTCTLVVGQEPSCTGGGHSPCDPSKDQQHCASSAVVLFCDQRNIDATGKGRWYGIACSALGASYVCREGSAGSGCGL